VMTTAGVKLAVNPDTVREPDIAFVRQDRIPENGVPDGYWPGAPDLAVEIRSPGDQRSEIAAKVADYLARGVRLVWVVDPKKKTVTSHTPLSSPVTLGGTTSSTPATSFQVSPARSARSSSDPLSTRVARHPATRRRGRPLPASRPADRAWG
jgi:hypothetical protein